MIKNSDEIISSSPEFSEIRKILLDSLEIALSSVDPYESVRKYLKIENNKLLVGNESYCLGEIGNIYLIAFGKASVKMSKAVLESLHIKEGIVVANEDVNASFKGVNFIKGSHPLPDENSIKAGKEALKIIEKTTNKDLTIVLISGGGSSLFEASRVCLQDLQNVTKLLLKKGATINELNTIRKHLSIVKGGGLLRHAKGKLISLIISDVINDQLDTIASGVTYYDSTTFNDSWDIIEKYNLIKEAPKSVIEIIKKGLKGEINDTLKQGENVSCTFSNYLIATNYTACKEVSSYFRDLGYNILYLGSSIQGEAKEAAKVFGGIAREIYNGHIPIKRPVVVVFGGETTVNVEGNGKGGRNSEFASALSFYLKDVKGAFTSFGTDGIDGTSKGAGGIVDSSTLTRAQKKGLSLEKYLKNNDTFSFLSALGDEIVTGPTGTNVADIGILIVL